MAKRDLIRISDLIKWQGDMTDQAAAEKLRVTRSWYNRVKNGAAPITEQFTLRFMAYSGQ